MSPCTPSGTNAIAPASVRENAGAAAAIAADDSRKRAEPVRNTSALGNALVTGTPRRNRSDCLRKPPRHQLELALVSADEPNNAAVRADCVRTRTDADLGDSVGCQRTGESGRKGLQPTNSVNHVIARSYSVCDRRQLELNLLSYAVAHEYIYVLHLSVVPCLDRPAALGSPDPGTFRAGRRGGSLRPARLGEMSAADRETVWPVASRPSLVVLIGWLRQPGSCTGLGS